VELGAVTIMTQPGFAIIAAVCLMAAWMTMATARAAEGPAPCPPAHHCIALQAGRLEVPDGYSSPTLVGAPAFDPNVRYFRFWMPDGSPAPTVDLNHGFYMWPDDGKAPMTEASRTLVMVTVCSDAARDGGGCASPDRLLQNMIGQDNYALDHHGYGGKRVDPKVGYDLINGTKPAAVDVDDIEQFGAFHILYGRADCASQGCAAHFHFRCSVKHPYPPYDVCDGSFEMKRIGLHAFLFYIGQNPALTLKMAEITAHLIDGWYRPTAIKEPTQ
jgi:hypothetical protein